MKDISGPVVVLYADVSGSTRLYEQFGDKIARADVSVCLDILTQSANELDGEILKSIGDEIMCLFHNPVKAALAASNMQTELREASEEGRFQSGALRIKIGWHYGPAFQEHGDLLGEAPDVAQQIIKLAKADEVLTSGKALAKLPPELRMTAHRINRIRAEATGEDIEVFVAAPRTTT
jgi:class 3 adenylate cyclase